MIFLRQSTLIDQVRNAKKSAGCESPFVLHVILHTLIGRFKYTGKKGLKYIGSYAMFFNI